VIVEEELQMVGSQALNGITLNLNESKRGILGRDTAQPHPTVVSRGLNEYFNTEQVSLFERIIWTGHPHTQLQMQHRMDIDMCNHLSESFYDSKVITHRSCLDRPKAKAFSDRMSGWYGCKPGIAYFI
jgi:regulator of nonsense transcripts 1